MARGVRPRGTDAARDRWTYPLGMAPRIAAVGLIVADMSVSVEFYGRLGLTFPDDASDQPHVEADLPGGLRLLLDTAESATGSFAPDWTPATGGPPVALAFECDDPADVDATYAELTAAGCQGHREPWDAFWNQRYAMLRDPDGNGVDLFAPL